MNNFEKLIQNQDFLPSLEYIALACGLIIGAFLFRRLNMLHKSLYVYIIIMSAVASAAHLLASTGNNLIVMPVYCILDLCCLTYLYNVHLLSKKNIFLISLSSIGLLYIIAESLNIFVFNELDVKTFQPYMKIVVNFVVIIYALYFIYEKINSYNDYKFKGFGLNASILITYTLTTLFFLPYNYFVNAKTLLKFIVPAFHVLIVSSYYFYITLLIWRNGRIQKH